MECSVCYVDLNVKNIVFSWIYLLMLCLAKIYRRVQTPRILRVKFLFKSHPLSCPTALFPASSLIFSLIVSLTSVIRDPPNSFGFLSKLSVLLKLPEIRVVSSKNRKSKGNLQMPLR